MVAVRLGGAYTTSTCIGDTGAGATREMLFQAP